MSAYSQIDPVEPRNWLRGERGWGFIAWSDLLDDEAPHRGLLGQLAAGQPGMRLTLPEYWRYEDYVEGRLEWSANQVSIYYETILSRLELWSKGREAVEAIREFLLPLTLSVSPRE